MNRVVFSVFVLTLIFFLEGVYPYFKERSARFKHAGPNVLLSLVNGLIAGVFFAGLTTASALVSEESQWGLFWRLPASPVLRILCVFIIFDLWIYVWHLANHRITFFWRLHRVHHNDPEMDVTTVLRFHPMEIMFSSTFNLAVIFVLGLRMKDLLVYSLVMQPVIAFHHSNIGLPEKWDRILRFLIVTPNMHRVHHSRVWKETHSNYGSVFSLWDRLFQTFRHREDTLTIDFGLGLFMQKKWQTLPGLLLMPFRKQDK